MKRKYILYILILLGGLYFACEKEEGWSELTSNFPGYKYADGEQVSLGKMSPDYVMIGCDTSRTFLEISQLIESKSYFNINYAYRINKVFNYEYKYTAVRLGKSCTANEIAWIIDDLEKDSIVEYVHYTMETDFCRDDISDNLGNTCVDSYANFFYVELANAQDSSLLKYMLALTNTSIKAEVDSLKYAIHVDKHSIDDALVLANRFYERIDILSSEPYMLKVAVD